MLRIKDVKARQDQYFKEKPIKALVKLQCDLSCSIDNDFYVLQEEINSKLLALEKKMGLHQFWLDFKYSGKTIHKPDYIEIEPIGLGMVKIYIKKD